MDAPADQSTRPDVTGWGKATIEPRNRREIGPVRLVASNSLATEGKRKAVEWGTSSVPRRREQAMPALGCVAS